MAAAADHIARAAELASGREFVDETRIAAGVAEGVDMGAAGAYGIRMLSGMDDGRVEITDDQLTISGTPRGGESAGELYAVLSVPQGGVTVTDINLVGGEQEAVRNLADAVPGERPAWFDALPTLETLEAVEKAADTEASEPADLEAEEAEMATLLAALPKDASNEDRANAVGTPAGRSERP